MTISQLNPWIGGLTKFDAPFSKLVSPMDESVASQIVESDAEVIEPRSGTHMRPILKHRDATIAKRVEWLMCGG